MHIVIQGKADAAAVGCWCEILCGSSSRTAPFVINESVCPHVPCERLSIQNQRVKVSFFVYFSTEFA